MIERVKENWEYRDMILSLTRRELRGRYQGSALGFLWAFLSPLCQIIVYSVVFSLIARNNLEKFYIYVITGMIPWFFFDNSVRHGSICIRREGDLVKKIYFPHEVLPIAIVTSDFINMLLCFVIVFLAIAVSGVHVSAAGLFCLPLIMLIEYMICLGCALMVSAITVYVKDMEHIVQVLLMPAIYVTPLLYTLDQMPRKAVILLKLNPMTYVAECYHAILYWGTTPYLSYVLRAGAFAVAILIIGELIFMKLDANFAEEF